MNHCIFCHSTTESFKTREHILPESLGGGDWAILRPGVFCDSCQNRFGSHIEQQALADYPFSLFRVILGVPTKKGRAPWTNTWEGKLQSGPSSGQIFYDPAPPFVQAMQDENKTVMRILAYPKKPEFICRFLLKMGIETIAQTIGDEVFNARHDEARTYALTGQKSSPWWYAQSEKMNDLQKYISGEAPAEDEYWTFGEIVDVGDGHSVFHLHLAYLDMIVPLSSSISPPEANEPEFRVFTV